jgi:hypothetical protein
VKPLSTAELLHVWETGFGQSPLQRGLLLLQAACPDLSLDALRELSIGERDDRLLTLREWAFGPRLVSLATCPICQERVEMDFQTADIRVKSPMVEEAVITLHEQIIRFRLPNSHDLMAVDGTSPKEKARHQLLERCIVSLAPLDPQSSAADPPAVLSDLMKQELVSEIAQRNAQANVKLNLSCPACEHHWKTAFDILAFFWEEINHWAFQILREIHQLALAYGWSEMAVLALSPRRRQFYLEMLGK